MLNSDSLRAFWKVPCAYPPASMGFSFKDVYLEFPSEEGSCGYYKGLLPELVESLPECWSAWVAWAFMSGPDCKISNLLPRSWTNSAIYAQELNFTIRKRLILLSLPPCLTSSLIFLASPAFLPVNPGSTFLINHWHKQILKFLGGLLLKNLTPNTLQVILGKQFNQYVKSSFLTWKIRMLKG